MENFDGFKSFSFPKWVKLITEGKFEMNGFPIGPYNFGVSDISTSWPTWEDVSEHISKRKIAPLSYVIVCDSSFDHGFPVSVNDGRVMRVSPDIFSGYYSITVSDVLTVAAINHTYGDI